MIGTNTGPKTCALASIALLDSGVFGVDAVAIAEEVQLLVDCPDRKTYLRVKRYGYRVALTRGLRDCIWHIFVGCIAQVELADGDFSGIADCDYDEGETAIKFRDLKTS